MLKLSQLDTDQAKLVDRIYDFDETIVYATMGSGKTVCYLTAISELMTDKHIKRALVVAPLNPCKHVWSQEHKKWEHLAHLKVAMAVGSPKVRDAAIMSDADIVVINIENLVWFLKSYGKTHNFDALCIDELSKFGDSGNQSVKVMRRHVKSFKHRVGLTGTPVHEGFTKLYSQVLMIDGGARFGTNKTHFLTKYFYATDYNQYNWELKPNMDKAITNMLSDLVYVMRDYTDALPTLVEKRIDVVLSDEAKQLYARVAQTSVIPIVDGEPILAENAAVLSGKLEQLANGFVYDEESKAHVFHSDKIAAFDNFMYHWDGKPLLIFYQYQHDKGVIMDSLSDMDIEFATIDSKNGMQSFLDNKVPVLLLHPKSAGHGLNLHTGGACQILCYAPIWSHDQHKQLIGRLWRRGQANTVTVNSLVSVGTVDELKLNRVVDKGEYDLAFKKHLTEI